MAKAPSGKNLKPSIANLDGADYEAALERMDDIGAQIAGLAPMSDEAKQIADEMDAAQED